MKRKLFCGLLCLLLVMSLGLTCYAQVLSRVVDDAGLLAEHQEAHLAQKAEELRNTYGMDVVILTVKSLEGKSSMQYAEDYYDTNGYGVDDNRSGTLFLLAMEEREWYIDTSGDAIYALTDYALLEQEELVVPYLREGDYFGAFDAWLDALNIYFTAYEEGNPVDDIVPEEDRYEGHEETVYYNEYDPQNSSVNWLISVGVGIAAAGITVLVMSSAMNTKRRENSAGNYMNQDSYHLRVHTDTFLYSRVSKTLRQSDSGSSGGGSRSRGGGSSVHRSSSGRSHGGRGGKF